MAGKFKIKKGDEVLVITGRDKGKKGEVLEVLRAESRVCLLYTSPSPRDKRQSRMPSSA